MEKGILLIVLGALILSLLSGAALAAAEPVYMDVVYDNTTYGLDVNVSNHAKIDNRFYFGTVASPGSSERTVIIPATFDEQVIAHVTFSGELAPWLTTKSYIPLLQPYSRLRITIILNLPSNVSSGIYSADMRVVFTKAGASAGESPPESDIAIATACSGCLKEGKCLSYGIRLKTDEGKEAYCDISGEWKGQLPAASDCQNSYECMSNLCANGKCIEAEENLNLIQKLFAWLRNLFGGK